MSPKRPPKDRQYGDVYVAALRLQHVCEIAGMDTQAAQAREIRRQAYVRLNALAATTEKPD
jgi:hypothetical protein